jgi:hypothetical protein
MRTFPSFASVLVLAALVAGPARAEFTRVTDLPPVRIFSLSATADTIVAGTDTSVFVSTDAGVSWRHSPRPAAGVFAITAVRMLGSKLYAGTFGQGVHVSNDLGASWQPFNDGLTGGFLDSQLDVVDLLPRGNELFAATAGAGVYARTLSPLAPWHSFGAIFAPLQAENVNSLALGGTRLLALGGANGMVFRRDPAQTEWVESDLDNIGIHSALTGQNAVFNGASWLVGTNAGVFRSVAGQEPWTRTDLGLGPIDWTAPAAQGRHLFAAFDIAPGAVIAESSDDGATWGSPEFFPSVFVQSMIVVESTLFAARGDGLWRRSLATLSVPPVATGPGLRFGMAGAQPFTDQARLRFSLPRAGQASLRLYDAQGRAVGDRDDRSWPAGPNEVSLNARALEPGIYTAVLTAGGARETLRLVHVR